MKDINSNDIRCIINFINLQLLMAEQAIFDFVQQHNIEYTVTGKFSISFIPPSISSELMIFNFFNKRKISSRDIHASLQALILPQAWLTGLV